MSESQTAEQKTWGEKLASDSIDDRVEALRQISSHPCVTGLTVPIVRLAGCDDDEVRMWSSEALESAVQPSSSELPLLVQLLEESSDNEACYWAATMLGRLGADAGTAASALESCVRQSMYLPARERATWALSQIGPSASVAIPTLREAAQNAPPRLQHLAAKTLEVIERQQRPERQQPPGKNPGGNEGSEEAAA